MGVYEVFSQPIEEVTDFNINYWRIHYVKLLARCQTGDLQRDHKRDEHEELAHLCILRIDTEISRRKSSIKLLS